MTVSLLTPPDIRALADTLGIRPTKTLGQNFVHDGGTVRAIAAASGVGDGARVLEVGPGLGSLTLALLETGAAVSAVELDPILADALPDTIARFAPDAVSRFAVIHADALSVSGPADLAVPATSTVADSSTTFEPTALVANLPYNVAVPVLLTLLAVLPSLTTAVVMVQAEVGERIVAQPGSKIYGIPSVKAQWYGPAKRERVVGRKVFWPVPNVDSVVVRVDRRLEPLGDDALRRDVFAAVDAAFAQRRKTLRAALAPWAGNPGYAEDIIREAGLDPRTRGEAIGVDEYVSIARAKRRLDCSR